jgi:inner membrane protein
MLTPDSLLLFMGHHAMASWLGIAAVFLILELTTMSGWLLWPAAAGAITALISRVTTIDVPTQAAVFAGLTAICTYIGRALTDTGSQGANNPNDRERRIVGLVGKAITSFKGGSGRVFVDGKEWSAELEGSGPVTPGTDVYVVRLVGGSRLKVRVSKK